MMNRLHRPLASIGLTAFALALIIAGCGGGGGGGSVPTPTPTPAPTGPTATPSPTAILSPPPGAPLTRSVFSFQSNPTGLTVKRNGVTLGITPINDQPQYSNTVNSYTIQPSNLSPVFTYLTDQTANGAHAVYYNQVADTNGSIGAPIPSAVGRSAQSLPLAFDTTTPRRMPERAGGRPLFSSSRLFVRYRASALRAGGRSANDLERFEAVDHAVEVGYEQGDMITRAINIGAGETVDSMTAKLRTHPEVVAVDPVHLRYKANTPFNPNDTHYASDQWGPVKIMAPNAWGYSQGNPAISIAVIDTGADITHQDLATKIVTAKKILNGYLYVGNSAITDTDGHGTNVAGIAAAATNNGFGYAGIGFNTSLRIYKVFADNGNADTADEALAIYQAVADGAKVINLSLGGCQNGGPDPAEHDAVAFALSHSVVVAAAAGNERAGSSDPSCAGAGMVLDFPAAYDGVISVGASALNDSASPGNVASAIETVASYSNTGPQLSLVAPGGDPSGGSDGDVLHWIANIYSTTATTATCTNKSDCRVFIAGTSQATPHVAGAAALMLAANPALTPAQIAQILTSTADDISVPFQGHGRLNLYRAMAAVVGDAAPAPPKNLNFVAFAYTNSGSGNRPTIADVTYPKGVAVASDGTFRIADLLPTPGNYKIGVWYDANGNGVVDAGDWFGSSGPCNTSAPCASATGINVVRITGPFTLP